MALEWPGMNWANSASTATFDGALVVINGKCVNDPGDQPRLAPVGQVEAPDRIVDGFVAIIDLCGEGPFIEVQHRSSDDKILIDHVIDMSPHQALGLDVEHLVAFKGDVDRRARIEDPFIDDPDPAQGIVNSIIDIFRAS